MPTVDPALGLVLRAGLALLFASAAAHKLRDVGAFRAALAGYHLLAAPWVVPAGGALIAAEVGVATGLWVPAFAPIAAGAAAGLLALYAGAIAVNLRRGRRDIDCGCGGPARRQPISAALVVRNAVLAAAALVAALPASGRSLIWVDAVTIVGGVGAVGLLYVAADGLLRTEKDRHRGIQRGTEEALSS